MATGYKRILAGDTGIVSFTLSLMTLRGKTARVETTFPFQAVIPNLVDRAVREKRKLRNRRDSLVTHESFHNHLPLYMRIARETVAQHMPDLVVLERFQARGGKGPVIEQISMMNMGLAIAAQENGAHIRLVTAGEWKMAVRRVDPTLLDTVYAEGRALKLKPHEIDSMCIGLYASLKDPFACLKNHRSRMLRQLVAAVNPS